MTARAHAHSLVLGLLCTAASADVSGQSIPRTPPMAEQARVRKVIADWPTRPRLAVVQMLDQYGAPRETSTESIVWHDAGPYKRIMVTRKEIPHDFPKPHMDFLEHTVSYDVPADKLDELIAFDASITVNRTAGEMSARCDLEGHNILTLNIARDVIMGKSSVAEARKAFGDNVVDDVLGKHPPYVEKLQFAPQAGAAFPDTPTINGSAVRASANMRGGNDAEVLAVIIAIDESEVLAGMAASKEQTSPGVQSYARMLHEAHGKSAVATMALGQEIGVTPLETKAVDEMRMKGAGTLAALVQLDGRAFERAFVDAMVKGHADVLTQIDSKLLGMAKHERVKAHLTAKRLSVASHLEQARKLR